MKKKLLLLSVLTSGICSAASAEEGRFANIPFLGGEGAYLKLEAGYSFPPTIKVIDSQGKIKIKKDNGLFGAALGYSPHEKVRFELAYRYDTQWKSKRNALQPVVLNGVNSVAAFNYRFKSQYAMPKMYVDLYDAELPNGAMISPYIGGGLGVSWIRNKGTSVLTTPGAANVVTAFKTKTRVKAAWEAIGGFTYKCNNTAVDLQYSYNDLGRTRVAVYNQLVQRLVTRNTPLRAHNVSLGFRFYL